MPAKRKTTLETQAALRRLFAACEERDEWPPLGMEQTPGYTIHRRLPSRLGTGGGEYLNREPVVWVFQRKVRVPGSLESRYTDPLVTALWDTLPEPERRRSRLFAHSAEGPVRFTKKGAIADAARPVRRYTPPTEVERAAVEWWTKAAPCLDRPMNDHEKAVAAVWDDLSPLHRHTLYSVMRRPGAQMVVMESQRRNGYVERPEPVAPELLHLYDLGPDREWVMAGAPSPEAFTSRVRTARRALARALAARFLPDRDYSIKTRGRRGFDYDRFWDDWEAHVNGEADLDVGEMP